MNRVLNTVLISIVLHLLLWLLMSQYPIPERHYNPIEVDIVEPKESKSNKPAKQFATQTMVPDKLKVQDDNDQVKFLSEKWQRVKEQMRAAQNGETENRDNRMKSARNPPATGGGKTMKDFSPSDDLHHPDTADNQGEGNGQHHEAGGETGIGLSTIAESINVKVGTMTALNTDQYLFYSFFHRVNQLVYLRWTHMVEAVEDRVAARLKGVSTDRWSTEVDIWLKPTGEYHSAHIMRESSITEFDRAAVAAFQQAGLFANPPHELVEDDGYIHLRYNLTVYMDPRSYSQVR